MPRKHIMSIMKLQELYNMDTATYNRLMILEREIKILEDEVWQDGHYYENIKTTVDVLNDRVEQIRRENIVNYKSCNVKVKIER